VQGGDAPEGPHREKAKAAWVAAVRGEVQRALERSEEVFDDALAGDALEIEIAATRAMHVDDELGRHLPGVKADPTGAASPGAQAQKSPKTVLYAAALRAAAGPAMACGTKQVGVTPGRRRLRQ
jgi:hypothetical protein